MESPSGSAVILPSTPQACADPPSPRTDSSRKAPMSATLKERLRKTRFSFNSCCSVVKRLKIENEENDQTFSEKPASSTEENCLEFQECFKHTDSESEEHTYLKNTLENISACESKSLDTGSHRVPQNDFVNENLKQGLKEEKAKLVKQVQEKEDLLRRLKLVKMYRSKNDLSQLQLLIKKWRSCSQLLLYELQSAMSEENKKLSLTQLIDYYGLDDKLLHYNRNEEEFIDV
ncbi:PREDICTED: swi5-dependent recombination DNA repair protein 1 homolog isoform X2 [Chinchilla lanigera]|uniref:Swi5-dependent recombination DNA repair protein 1 homolog n=2 Tax=Chinchilla lanigera TaxID=34839 RepID=A0A8C2UM02_CHILA|nr:PREDICTED: swi5-dependent recombination DNA repair protein 1 homolog isoform X2 [Chinchilla lanigera]XP_005403847.1 PREDICTED: swi5-dependent recombination DNA repair protein 1 homolog isoform X2 [Chinchilla lanigera]XP_005403848.1 PREDICTED: swi5-dependent recombination DNA repair protein 1 homolog isoform X2 [Chinchilla lanigera]XP_013359525.1 PREDICTED: swi5-dependent recombination DNA repair protein 1 homolog isoform X2 [Chinchilla lanigera]XP_013359526.1 PREDICTED: swi5-dependent recomb